MSSGDADSSRVCCMSPRGLVTYAAWPFPRWAASLRREGAGIAGVERVVRRWQRDAHRSSKQEASEPRLDAVFYKR